jgi:hypothetical protein
VCAVSGAVLMMLMAALPAFGQLGTPCDADFEKFCSGVTPGGGRLLQCYEQNKNQMSANCVGWAETVKSNAAAVKAACADMVNSRCADEQGDPLGMLNCLESNYIDLTMNCRVQLNQFKDMYPMPVQ